MDKPIRFLAWGKLEHIYKEHTDGQVNWRTVRSGYCLVRNHACSSFARDYRI